MKVQELLQEGNGGKRFQTVVVRGRFRNQNEVSEDGLLGMSKHFLTNAQKARAQKMDVGSVLNFKNTDDAGTSKVYIRRVA